MAKKHKSTAEFSPRAMRIYKIAQKGVAARSNQHSVLRAIDNEISTVKVGNPDLELKEEIVTLKSQLADEQQAGEILATSHSQLKTDVDEARGETAEWEKEFKNLSVEFQKVSGENDDRGLEIIKLEEKVTELEESAGSDPAEAVGAGPPYKDETPDPDADPDDSLKDEEDANVKADSGDPPSQPAK